MNGVLNINKPREWRSTQVVNLIKKAYPHRKVGHIGTLDPLATGVLPICVGEATKLAEYLLVQEKEYRTTMLLGQKSDTFDMEGKLSEGGSTCHIDEGMVLSALNKMQGSIQQQTPAYSAVKRGGTPLYKMARRGIVVETPTRTVHIYDIRLEGYQPPRVDFWVRCSKGTYIRALCAAIGEDLGCSAVVEALCRTRSGRFHIAEAISLDSGDVAAVLAATAGREISVSQLVSGMCCFVVGAAEKERVRNGCQPTRDVIGVTTFANVEAACGEVVGLLDERGNAVAIGRMLYDTQEIPLLPADIVLIELLRVFNET